VQLSIFYLFTYLFIFVIYLFIIGQHSSVGIATCYGLDGPGSNPDGGREFPPVQNGPGVHPATYTMGTGSFAGVKRPGRGVDHPPSSSA